MDDLPGCLGGANQSEILVVFAEVHWIVLAEEVPVSVEVGWEERSELECHFGGEVVGCGEREIERELGPGE